MICRQKKEIIGVGSGIINDKGCGRLAVSVTWAGTSFFIGLVIFIIAYFLMRLLTERMEHRHENPPIVDKKNRKIK